MTRTLPDSLAVAVAVLFGYRVVMTTLPVSPEAPVVLFGTKVVTTTLPDALGAAVEVLFEYRVVTITLPDSPGAAVVLFR